MRVKDWLLEFLARLSSRRTLSRKAAALWRAASFQVLESRCLLTTLSAVDDTYDAVFGEALVARGVNAPLRDEVTLVNTVTTSDKYYLQMEYSAPQQYLFARTESQEIVTFDARTNLEVDRRRFISGRALDMDLTPDGQFLFVCENNVNLSSPDSGFQYFRVHRLNVSLLEWETQDVPFAIDAIEGISGTSYIAAVAKESRTITVHEFEPGASEVSSGSPQYDGAYRPVDIEYDHRSGLVLSADWPLQIFAVSAGTVTRVPLPWSGPNFDGTPVFSVDGRFAFVGIHRILLEPLSLTSSRYSAGIIGASSRFLFHSTGYFTTSGGNFNYRLPVGGPLMVSEDGQHLWAHSNLTHYRIGKLANSVLSNDARSATTTVRLATDPAHGVVTLNPDGGFRYVADPAFVGEDRFTYELADGPKRSTGTVTIRVPAPGPRTLIRAQPDEYTINTGSVLTTDAHPVRAVSLDFRKTLDFDSDVEQIEYSSPFDLFITRSSSRLRIQRASTGELVKEANAVANFVDMDLTPDGRFLFVADSVLGTSLENSFISRYDLQLDRWSHWPQSQTPTISKIGAVSSTRYLGQHQGDSTELTLNDVDTQTVVARMSIPARTGKFVFNGRTGIIVYIHGLHFGSTKITTLKLSGDTFLNLEFLYLRYGDPIQSQHGVLSPDGRHFYSVREQIDAAIGGTIHSKKYTHPIWEGHVLLFDEFILGASNEVAFGKDNYFDASTGSRLGSYGFTATSIHVSDDGRKMVASDGTRFRWYDIKTTTPGVFANDSGMAAPFFTARVVTPPSHGAITLNDDGSFRYVPNNGFLGDDSFSYQGEGRSGQSTTANVTVHVKAPSLRPIGEAYSFVPTKTLSVAQEQGLLQNDLNVTPGVTLIEVVTAPANGRLTIYPDGTFSFASNLSSSAPDFFKYRLREGETVSRSATVMFTPDLTTSAVTLVDGELAMTLSQQGDAILSLPDSYGQISVVAGQQSVQLQDFERSHVRRVRVTGSQGADLIDLRAVSATLFPNLRSVTIESNGGADVIYGSPFSDRVAPKLTSITRRTPNRETTNANTLVFRATFSEPMTDVDVTDFAAVGTTAFVTSIAPAPLDPLRVFHVTLSGGDLSALSGHVGLQLAARHYLRDRAGNALDPVLPSINETFEVDHQRPLLTITGPVDWTNSSSIAFTFNFTEPVTGFAAGDIHIQNGTRSSFQRLSTTRYEIVVEPTTDGNVELTVAEGAARDRVGLLSPARRRTAYVDRTAPTLTVVGAQIFETPDKLQFNFNFSEPVFGFESSDISVTRGTKDGFRQIDAQTFELIVKDLTGTVGVDVARFAAVDHAGNRSFRHRQTFAVDLVRPVVTIGAPSRSLLVVGQVTFPISINDANLSENELQPEDVVVTSDNGMVLDIAFDASTGPNRQVIVKDYDRIGTFRISLREGAVRDRFGNRSLATALSAPVTYEAGVVATIDESFLVIFSTHDGDFANQLTLTFDTTQQVVIVTDPTSKVQSDIPNAANLSANSVSIPTSSALIIVNMSAGNDTIVMRGEGTGNAFSGEVRLSGADGNDTLRVDPSINGRFVHTIWLAGDAGDDVLDASALTAASEIDLQISGEDGNDQVRGSARDDILSGGAGNDTIDAGAGTDLLVEVGDVNFVLTNTSVTGLGTDALSSIESARLYGGDGNNRIDASAFSGKTSLNGEAGDDTLLGGTNDDRIIGNAGNDSLVGGAGRDSLNGGSGIDFLDGGAGFVDLIVRDSYDMIVFDALDI